MECVFALIAFTVGFVVAQFWKFVAGLMNGGKQRWTADFRTAVGYLTRSGGMPSGHAASLTALMVYLGFAEGFGSGLFALAMGVWMIVIYDAIHVRYAVGEQGKALNKLLAAAKKPELPIVEGHTVKQVVVGVMIGVVVGMGVAALAVIL